MSSDADYEAFLNKANQGSSDAKATSKSKSVGTKSVDTSVPKGLEKVDEFFTSESDEPFEPVSLKYDGDKVPSAGWCPLALEEGAFAYLSNADGARCR
jgi:hypothetical protein